MPVFPFCEAILLVLRPFTVGGAALADAGMNVAPWLR